MRDDQERLRNLLEEVPGLARAAQDALDELTEDEGER
jgi:hypothetical protein